MSEHRYRNSAAIARGFCVPKDGDPTEFPVTWHDGTVWRLTANGDRERVA